MTRILLTGSTGQVGAELTATLASVGELLACDHRRLDLADPAAIRATVREFRPTIIVNAAAYTAVDLAESEPDLAMAVNGAAPGVFAEEAARTGALLVHYSTDYVFNGEQPEPYTEEDSTDPLNIYGRTKRAGELAIRATSAKHLILRTSWVYGATGKNFLVTIRRLAAARDELKIVNDQFGAPTWCRDIATATAAMLGHLTTIDPVRAAGLSGTYNLSAEGATSWFEFAAAIFADSPLAPESRRAKLVAIPSSEYPTPAARPRNSVLAHDKLHRRFGLKLPPWRTSLQACLAGLAAK